MDGGLGRPGGAPGSWWGLVAPLVLAAVPLVGAASPEHFDALLERLEAGSAESEVALVDDFVARQLAEGGFPITDVSGEVVFVFLASPDVGEVRLVGDFLPSSPMDLYWSAGEPMRRAGHLFYLRRQFEPGARLDYAFVVDGERTVDPLNPRQIFSGTGDGPASELVMPGHRLQAATRHWPAASAGTLQTLDEPWAIPKVTVYLPAEYDASRRYPVVYTGDGSAWVENIGLPVILDNLVYEGSIEPVIAVMIDAAEQRNAWHLYNPDYLDYLVRVVRHVDASWATRAGPDGRVLAGSSSAGRATLYAGLERPDLFQRLALLSPSMHGPLFYLAPYLSGDRQPDPGLELWLSAGTYEGAVYRDARVLEDWGRRAGIEVLAAYSAQGHSFGQWRESAVFMLRHYFGVPESP